MVEFLRNFLSAAAFMTIVVAGVYIGLWLLMFLLILLPEEISNRIYDWRHRHDPD